MKLFVFLIFVYVYDFLRIILLAVNEERIQTVMLAQCIIQLLHSGLILSFHDHTQNDTTYLSSSPLGWA